MQGEAADRVGEPSGQGEETPLQGLGGDQLLAEIDAGGPAGQVVGEDTVSSTGLALDGQPGGVGSEAARWEVVEPDAVLEISDGVLDLGVAAMLDLQFQGIPSRSVKKPR